MTCKFCLESIIQLHQPYPELIPYSCIYRYTTPLCICYEPETLAAASFLLAYSLLNDILPSLPQNWTDHFDIDWQDEEDVHEVDVVMQRVLDLWTHARNDKIKQAGNDLKQVRLMPQALTKVS